MKTQNLQSLIVDTILGQMPQNVTAKQELARRIQARHQARAVAKSESKPPLPRTVAVPEVEKDPIKYRPMRTLLAPHWRLVESKRVPWIPAAAEGVWLNWIYIAYERADKLWEVSVQAFDRSITKGPFASLHAAKSWCEKHASRGLQRG